jgi:RES domain
MSDKPQIGNMSADLRGSSSVSATLGAISVPTGREISADAEHALAAAWSACTTHAELTNHNGCSRFRTAIHAAPILSVAMDCFRGRVLDPGDVPSSSSMGPPPANRARAGRYNADGESVLYLSDSKDGVLRECPDDGRHLWIQEFSLPVGTRIVDTSVSTDGKFVNQVFWFTELAEDHERMPGPTFSQFVAQIVAERSDGMLVRGVRGEPNLRYCNIVMFRPEADWALWVSASSAPTKVR